MYHLTHRREQRLLLIRRASAVSQHILEVAQRGLVGSVLQPCMATWVRKLQTSLSNLWTMQGGLSASHNNNNHWVDVVFDCAVFSGRAAQISCGCFAPTKPGVWVAAVWPLIQGPQGAPEHIRGSPFPRVMQALKADPNIFKRINNLFPPAAATSAVSCYLRNSLVLYVVKGASVCVFNVWMSCSVWMFYGTGKTKTNFRYGWQ